MTLGILCGLKSEAAIARKIPNVVVACSAARPQQARWAARELIKQGATRLLSFGLAGGLEPGLPVGTAIIGTSVKAMDGSWESNNEWSAKLMQQLPTAHCGPVWGAETIVAAVQGKRALYERSRCLVTDMESHCVAQIASEARVPFAVLRVITDTSDMVVPSAALVPLHENGRVNVGKVLLNLLRQPKQLPSLIHLGLNTGTAMRTLKDLTRALDPSL